MFFPSLKKATQRASNLAQCRDLAQEMIKAKIEFVTIDWMREKDNFDIVFDFDA